MRKILFFVSASVLTAQVFAWTAIAQDATPRELRVIEAADGFRVRIDDSPSAGADGTPHLTDFALGFYQGDKPLYEYRLGELVAKPALLAVEGGRVRWIAESSLHGNAFHLSTVDGQVYEFHVPTGEIRYLKKKYQ